MRSLRRSNQIDSTNRQDAEPMAAQTMKLCNVCWNAPIADAGPRCATCARGNPNPKPAGHTAPTPAATPATSAPNAFEECVIASASWQSPHDVQDDSLI
jgi:hypothetical protein